MCFKINEKWFYLGNIRMSISLYILNLGKVDELGNDIFCKIDTILGYGGPSANCLSYNFLSGGH